MHFNTIFDSREHDSGYITPSPDKPSKKNEVDRPPHSYIALISMAILSKSDKKILLNEIYDWVLVNFKYYQNRSDKSWRNSIRHNLSLNECFIKVGKAGNGRGYYWSIHPANLDDFKNGDFRRRQARLRAKHDKYSASLTKDLITKQSSPIVEQKEQNQCFNFQWTYENQLETQQNSFGYYSTNNFYNNQLPQYQYNTNPYVNLTWLQHDALQHETLNGQHLN
jgi:hypothetical protein